MTLDSPITDEIVRRFKTVKTAASYIRLLSSLCLPCVCSYISSEGNENIRHCETTARLGEALRRFPGNLDIESALKARPDLFQQIVICLLAKEIRFPETVNITTLIEAVQSVVLDIENDTYILALDQIITKCVQMLSCGQPSMNENLSVQENKLFDIGNIAGYSYIDLIEVLILTGKQGVLPVAFSSVSVDAAIVFNMLKREYFKALLVMKVARISSWGVSSKYTDIVLQNCAQLSADQLSALDDINLGAVYFLKKG